MTDRVTETLRQSTIGASFARVDAATASHLLAEQWGVQAHALVRLETENDDTFRVDTGAVTEVLSPQESPVGYVFKLANPADDPAELDLQTRALLHARHHDSSLPLQRIVPSKTGALLHRIVLANGDVRIGRVLTFLPGSPLQDTPCDLDQLRAAGRVQARLAAALRDFEHPAARRALPWDLQQLPSLEPKLETVSDLDLRAEMSAVLITLRRQTLPRVQKTRRQVIHNDFHGGNVIVNADDPDFVTGILDFGDTVDSFLIADLAIAMSYAGGYPSTVRGEPAAWAAADAVRDGYCEVTPLTERERELLHPLVIGRLVQRYVLGSWLAAIDPANAGYTAKNLQRTREQFDRMRSSP